MIILHIITSTLVGGAERMLQKLILNSQDKCNHIVLSLKPIGPVGQELLEAGIKVYCLNIIGPYSIIRSWKKIFKIIKGEKIQLIQTWLYHGDLVGSIIGLFVRLPVVWNIRQTKFDNRDPVSTRIVMKLCAFLSYFIPAKIICAAHASALQHKRYGYNYKKMQVISNGFPDNNDLVSAQQICLLKEKLRLKSNDIIIGAIGRYHPIKDFDTFLRASKEVSSVIDTAKFLMVGRDLDINNVELCEKIKALDILDKVILVGEQKDINPYLLLMKAFCLTSISEGFPNVLAEAMIMSTPAFSTKCGDAELIQKDVNFLVDIGDYKNLSAQLINFFNLNESERIKIGKDQRELVLKNFPIEKVVNNYLDVYKGILKK